MKNKSDFSIFLENNQNEQKGEAAYIYNDPIEIIIVTDFTKIEQGFRRIQRALDQNYHVAGYISYEAGYSLEKKLETLCPDNPDYPFLYMGIYEKRQILSTQEADEYWQTYDDVGAFCTENVNLSLDRTQYETAFNQIQEHLKAGDIYQVNFTQKASFDFKGSTKAFYSSLRHAQAVEYGAYMQCDGLTILSLSPELFIKKTNNHLIAKPMKGTCKRGRNFSEDKKQITTLYNSDKERAENLMIVDLLRNDLSRMAQKGSVKVDRLFAVEKYRTLFTMTSTIRATLGMDHSALDVIKSIYPCGSVTGAPKIRAMEIIAELENHQRGIYTGAIGYFTPDGDMCFNVPIRTLTINDQGKGELGLGGAIVADGNAISEYDECLLKAEFFTKKYSAFDLIETFLWQSGQGYRYLADHLQRLEASAKYFSMKFNRKEIYDALKTHGKYIAVGGTDKFKVRLLLSRQGNFSISSQKIQENDSGQLPPIILSEDNVESQDVMLFHKTTKRDFFARQFKLYHEKTGCYDVIFLNENGEVTQGSFTNIFIKKDGIHYTPPIECGLLAGIGRQKLLEDKGINCQLKKLYIDDILSADHVYLCNSIRGMIEVYFLRI